MLLLSTHSCSISTALSSLAISGSSLRGYLVPATSASIIRVHLGDSLSSQASPSKFWPKQEEHLIVHFIGAETGLEHYIQGRLSTAQEPRNLPTMPLTTIYIIRHAVRPPQIVRGI